MIEIILLLLSLAMILASAEIFTNGVETFGRRLSLSQAVVGSILAAVGTALPETVLPFVAILVHGGSSGTHIGVGAILGAPFMLSTLAFFLVGVTAVVSFFRNKRRFELNVELHGLKRDLAFFIVMYGAAICVPHFFHGGRGILAAILVAAYLVYAVITFRGESQGIIHAEELYFRRLKEAIYRRGSERSGQEGIALIVFQIFCSLVIMVGGAHVFVSGLETLSGRWGINPLLFALLVAPIATELPEKVNSISWTLKGRDTLAIGNITGAMVFQSTFPVSLGLLFTGWDLSGFSIFSAILALLSAAVVLIDVSIRRRLSPLTVMLGGLFYAVYAVAIILG